MESNVWLGETRFLFREWYTPRMPELPELEVVKEVLRCRVVDQTIEGVQAIGGGSAILVRALTQQRLEEAWADGV
jgi:hypothetical protein